MSQSMKWIVGLALMVVFAMPAEAAIVLDQSYTETANLGGVINSNFKYVGQTFTAGVTGTLVDVRVDSSSTETTSPLRISIFDTITGTSVPNSNLLTSQLLSGSQSLITNPITLSNPISVVSGHVYLLALDYPSNQPNQGTGFWFGVNGGGYFRGNEYFGNPNGAGIAWTQSSIVDLRFQTFVEVAAPVPEPASMIIWSLGALGCAIAGYRRRKMA